MSLYLARRAVAHTALEPDVHVVLGAPVCDRSLGRNLILLLRVNVEYVAISAGRGRLGRGVVVFHVQLVGKIDAPLGCVVRLVVKV